MTATKLNTFVYTKSKNTPLRKRRFTNEAVYEEKKWYIKNIKLNLLNLQTGILDQVKLVFHLFFILRIFLLRASVSLEHANEIISTISTRARKFKYDFVIKL